MTRALTVIEQLDASSDLEDADGVDREPERAALLWTQDEETLAACLAILASRNPNDALSVN